MRKSLLKSLVATAVVGATMAITSVAAMAADYEWVYSESGRQNAKVGVTVTANASEVTRSGAGKTFSEEIFTTGDGTTSDINGIKAIDMGSGQSVANPVVSVKPQVTGTLYIWGMRTGSSSASSISYTVDDGDEIKITFPAYGTQVNPITIAVEKDRTYKFNKNASNTKLGLYAIYLDEASENVSDIAGTVSPKDATLTVSNGIIKSNDNNGNVTVTVEEGKTATLTAKANDYVPGSTEIASTSESFSLALAELTATNDSTNTISTAQLNADDDVIFTKAISANGFTITPNKSGTITFNRIQLTTDSTIVYTAPSDGTLTVTGASANATATDRGFSLTSSNASEKFDNVLYASNSAVDKTFDVTKGNTYTITVVGGNINVTSVKFEDSATPALTEGTFEATGGKVVVKGTNAYLVGEFTTLDANGQLSVGDKVFTTDTVYTSVVDGNDTIAAEKDGTYYYAVKVTDLTSDEEVAPLKRFTVA